MATVLVHRTTHARFVLLGAGFGMYKSSTPGMFLGNLDPNVKSGSASLLAVCDAHGQIGWVRSTEVVVASVDGHAPHEYLMPAAAPPSS